MIEAAVFICGAVLMVFELVGSRVLAPYFGTSIVVWTNLIGIILGSLSLGYYLGGKKADKKPQRSIFASIVLIAGFLILAMTLYKDYILPPLGKLAFSNHFMASFVAVLLLFTPASIYLGMISPYAARLKIKQVSNSGSTVGRLYAVITIGSLSGTFLGGYILISYLGTRSILMLLSSVLVITGCLIYGLNIVKNKKILLLVLLAIGLTVIAVFANTEKKLLEDTDSLYNRITIYDVFEQKQKQTVRVMKLDNAFSSTMYLGSDDLMFRYTKYYRLLSHFYKSPKKVLMIGGAGYSYPKDYLNTFDKAEMDVVEIDQKVTELAQKYFNLKDDPRLKVYHEDGRTYINRNTVKYDAILGDAFRAKSIPYQLTTKEAIQKMYDSLNKDGVLFVSIISAIEGDNGKFLRAEYKTLKSVFPQVYLFTITQKGEGTTVRNMMLVGIKGDTKPEFVSNNPEFNDYLSFLWTKKITDDVPILTDDFAPVEQYNRLYL